MAPQLIGTNGASALRLLACRARTTSSLPVPDSPVTSTVESVGATLARMRKTSFKVLLWPMMPSTLSSITLPGPWLPSTAIWCRLRSCQ